MDATETHETLYDGKDMLVVYADAREEVIKVRKVPRDEFGKFAMLCDGTNEDAECGFYAGRDAEWARTLSEESYDLVLKEGQDQNFTRFTNWCERQARRLDLLQGQGKLMEKSLALLEHNPALKRLLDSTNGSSVKATANGTSGVGARLN